MTITIRKPGQGDRAAWQALWRGYQQFYQADLSADEDRLWRVLLDPPAEGPHALLAVDENGEPVGLTQFLFHVTTWSPQRRCYLNDLFTAPKARGRGVGRLLIEAVDERARAAGCGQTWWLTANDNLTARKLYDQIADLTPFVKYVLQAKAR